MVGPRSLVRTQVRRSGARRRHRRHRRRRRRRRFLPTDDRRS